MEAVLFLALIQPFINNTLILLSHSLSLFYERVKMSDDFLIDVNLHVTLIEDGRFRL